MAVAVVVVGGAGCGENAGEGTLSNEGSDPVVAAGVVLADDGMLELGSSFAPVDGEDVGLFSGISEYEGPGEYDLSALRGIDGSPFAITAGDLAYQADEGSTGSLTLDASGSGTLDSDGFTDIGTPEPAEPGITGAVTWTCIDPM